MKLIQATLNRLRGCELWAMSNLGPRATGINVTIFVSPRGRARHGPRIKVGQQISKGNLNFSMTISQTPQVVAGQKNVAKILDAKTLAMVTKWVQKNEKHLIEFWFGKIQYIEDLLPLLEKV